MGWCHEFGLQIRDGCGHPMQAGDTACSCPECGIVCGGRFAGCPDVWAQKLQPTPAATESDLETVVPFNGTARRRASRGPDRQRREMITGGAESAEAESIWDEPPAVTPETVVPHASPSVMPAQDDLGATRPELQEHRALTRELLNGLAQQQALLQGLIEARGGDAHLEGLAESLPDQVATAAAEPVARTLEANRQEILGAVFRLVEAGRKETLSSVSRLVEAGQEETVAAVAQAAEAARRDTLEAVTRVLEAGRQEVAAAAAEATEAAATQGVDMLRHALEQSLKRYARRHPAETAAELRTFIETDPAAGSAIAAIATQAAAQALGKELATSLAPAVQRAADRIDRHAATLAAKSDERMEELVERMEKLVGRAVRAGARAGNPPTDEPRGSRATKAAKSPAANTKTAKKATGATRRVGKASSPAIRRTAAAARRTD